MVLNMEQICNKMFDFFWNDQERKIVLKILELSNGTVGELQETQAVKGGA